MHEEPRFYMEIAALGFGSFSGVLHAWQRKYDFVGIMVIGIVSSVGGGIIRDVLIAEGPPLAIKNSSYLGTVIFATFIGMFFGSLIYRMKKVLWTVDALALGFFTIAGMQRALYFKFDILSALFLGIVTSVCGGILRDVLSRETPVIILPGQPYSMAALLAGLVYLFSFRYLKLNIPASEALAIISCFMLRTFSAVFKWHVPVPPDLYKVFSKRKVLTRLRNMKRNK